LAATGGDRNNRGTPHMHISKVTISDFRSIKYAEIIPSEFNIFVGQNNHGKTNFFEAIEWFYNGSGNPTEIAHMQDESLDYSVEIEFSGIQAGIETVQNEKTKASFRKFAGDKDVIRVIRRKSDGKKRCLWDETAGDWTSKNFAGFDTAFNDCIPRLEYISTTTRLGDVSKWGKKTPIGQMLSGVLTVILEKSETYKDFRRKFDEVFSSENSDIRVSLNELSGKVKVHLEQQFPDCTKVSFEISEPAFDDLLKNFETSINDGIETKAEDKGDGMQRALMLAIIKTYSDYRRENDELGKRFVFLIDEAELHLHPTAQRQLKNALLVLSQNGDQIFINTHSSVLVTDDTPEQSVYCVVKTDCITGIKKIKQSEKSDVIYDLLGGSPSDLLFPQNFVIVEGRSDEIFLRQILERFYRDKPNLKVIFACGEIQEQEKIVSALNKVFTPLYQTPIYRDKVIIICDKPNEQQKSRYQEFEKAYPVLLTNGQLLYLSSSSLEESYPAPWKKSAAEVSAMSMRDKTELAEIAGKGISKDVFEAQMPDMLKALSAAWEKAHK
jgi:AAA15 family ATPase/GTPase